MICMCVWQNRIFMVQNIEGSSRGRSFITGNRAYGMTSRVEVVYNIDWCYWLIDLLIDWWFDWLIDWLIDDLIDWLIDWSYSINWFIDSLTVLIGLSSVHIVTGYSRLNEDPKVTTEENPPEVQSRWHPPGWKQKNADVRCIRWEICQWLLIFYHNCIDPGSGSSDMGESCKRTHYTGMEAGGRQALK